MNQFTLKQYMRNNPDAKLRDIVVQLLYDEIINLKIIPGTKLNVNQISSSLGISRTPVAEAITRLTEVGFVVQHEGQSGSFVLSLDQHDMINLYRVRSAIESESAALCAHAADDATIRKLYTLAEAFKDSVAAKDIQGMKDTDMPFHRLIVESCGNPYLIQSYELLLPKLTMYQSSMLRFLTDSGSETNPWMPSVLYNHVSIVSAIRMRMPSLARQSMAEHVDASLNFTALSGNGGDPFQLVNENY